VLFTACEYQLWCPMARRHSGYSRHRSLSLVFDGAYTDVDIRTIQAYLPKLWRHHGHEIAHTRFLSLDAYCPHRRRIHPKAIQLLGQYLCEVDRKSPVSAALSTGLEDLWRMFTYRGGDAVSLTGDVFISLGIILDPKYFGCNTKIFRELELFFQRHCTRLFQEAPDYWMRHLEALDRMSLNLIRRNPTIMAPILSSVLHETRLESRDLRPLFQASNLNKCSRGILATLVRKDEQRPSFTHGYGLHLGCSSTTRPKPRRSASFSNLPLRGDELVAPYGPHSMTVDHSRPRINDSYYEDDFSDDDYPYDDDPSLFDQLLEDDHLYARDLDHFMPSPCLGHPSPFGYFPPQAMLSCVH